MTSEKMASAPTETTPGTRLGRYELLADLGSGGMASVHLARIVGPGTFRKLVALKRIHPHLANRRDVVEMFVDEASIAARISHPNICSVIDFGEIDGSWFMAMEYLEGAPLSSLLKASIRYLRQHEDGWRNHVAFICRSILGACKGLHAAHEARDERGVALDIVHRDISPDNLFVTYGGEAKVVDFGIATGRGKIHQTTTGIMKGKIGYVAPETFGPSKGDRRMDIWALGVLLWEGLCLERLFWCESPQQTMTAIFTRPVPPPSELRPGVPGSIDPILMRALERQVIHRWPTAADLSDALEGVCQKEGLAISDSEAILWLDRLLPGHREALRAEVGRVLDENEPSAFQIPQLPFSSDPDIELVDVKEALPATVSLLTPEKAAEKALLAIADAPTKLLSLPAEQPNERDPTQDTTLQRVLPEHADAPTTEIQATPAPTPTPTPAPVEVASTKGDENEATASTQVRIPSDVATEVLPVSAPATSSSTTGWVRPLFWLVVVCAMGCIAGTTYWLAGFFPPVASDGHSIRSASNHEAPALPADHLALIHGTTMVDASIPSIPPASTQTVTHDASASSETSPQPALEPSGHEVDAAAISQNADASALHTTTDAVASSTKRPGRTPSRPPRKRPPRPRQEQPPESAQQGTVRVATPGGWAEVYHRGRRLASQTPARVRLPVGRQVLELRFRGGTSRRRVAVTVQPDRSVAVVEPAP